MILIKKWLLTSSRPAGLNWLQSRFRLAAAVVTAVPACSFLIDAEAIVTDDDGLTE